jgi:HK97 family phage major capsid protein
MIKSFHNSIEAGLVEKMQNWSMSDVKVAPYFADQKTKMAMSKDIFEGSNPNGGYWIIPEYSAQDVTRDFETSPMRDICNVVTTSSNVFRHIIDDNLAESGGWVGEVQERTSTDTARIGELDITVHEQYAEPKASHWMLDDATFDLVGWISNKSRQTMTLQENAAFLVGDGSKKPRGILNYPAWGGTPVEFGNDSNYERGALETIYSGASGNFTYDGLINVQMSLLEPYQPGAVWLTTRQGWAQILKIKDTQDRPLFQLQDLLRTGAQAVLLGKPVRIAAPANAPINPEQPTGGGMPIPGADAKAMIYGDFRQGYRC